MFYPAEQSTKWQDHSGIFFFNNERGSNPRSSCVQSDVVKLLYDRFDVYKKENYTNIYKYFIIKMYQTEIHIFEHGQILHEH